MSNQIETLWICSETIEYYWKEVIMKEKIKIHVLHTGSVEVYPGLLQQKNPYHPFSFMGLFQTNKSRVRIPVSCYLIEHPKGVVLIDTGWGTQVREEKVNKLSPFIPHLPKQQAMKEQLAKLGYTSQEIDYVILSHLDNDHASGLNDVKDAKNFLVSEPELAATERFFQKRMRYIKSQWQKIPLQTFPFDKKEGPFQASYDLFKDNSVQLIWTPGHSLGMLSVLIQNKEQEFVLLINDTGYVKDSWQKLHIPGISVSPKKALTSLEWVQKKAQDPKCIEILANHDPEITPTVIEL